MLENSALSEIHTTQMRVRFIGACKRPKYTMKFSEKVKNTMQGLAVKYTTFQNSWYEKNNNKF